MENVVFYLYYSSTSKKVGDLKECFNARPAALGVNLAKGKLKMPCKGCHWFHLMMSNIGDELDRPTFHLLIIVYEIFQKEPMTLLCRQSFQAR